MTPLITVHGETKRNVQTNEGGQGPLSTMLTSSLRLYGGRGKAEGERDICGAILLVFAMKEKEKSSRTEARRPEMEILCLTGPPPPPSHNANSTLVRDTEEYGGSEESCDEHSYGRSSSL